MSFNSLFGYIGPGAGLGMISALIGLALAVISALAFVLVWPLRVLRRKLKNHVRH
jgi:hypothetical protein